MNEEVRHDTGKLTAELKTLVTEDTKDAVNAIAFLRGQTVSEYLRDIIHERLFGEIHKVRLKHRTKNEKSRNTDDSRND